MRYILCCLAAGFGILATSAQAGGTGGNNVMKIKLAYDGKNVIVRMADNSAARQFAEMLPATFDFIDFAGQEKISEFSKPVSLNGVFRGMIAKAGKMFIYIPWGNWGFFYKDHGNTIDNNLIELGEIESGLDFLSLQKGGFSAEITVLSEND